MLAVGDVRSPVFPRSAIKSLQCLPVVMTGAADAFGFSQRELAFCCASHSGTEEHATCALGLVERLGLSDGSFVCGPHLPLGEAHAHAMLRANKEPRRCHNNCSGKHSGMLATAVHLGEPVADYHLPEHPVQKRVHATLAEVTGLSLDACVRGTDGCSVPNWAMPLDVMAQTFARFVGGTGLPSAYAAAAERITEACWAHPEMVAGPDRLDTELMERFPGEVFVKTGAEGVYCGAIKSRGLGFALKIEDGAKRGAEAAVCALVGRLVADGVDLAAPRVIRNWRGTEVGEIRSSDELASALGKLQ